MPFLHHSLGDPQRIDVWAVGPHEEQSHESTIPHGFSTFPDFRGMKKSLRGLTLYL